MAWATSCIHGERSPSSEAVSRYTSTARLSSSRQIGGHHHDNRCVSFPMGRQFAPVSTYEWVGLWRWRLKEEEGRTVQAAASADLHFPESSPKVAAEVELPAKARVRQHAGLAVCFLILLYREIIARARPAWSAAPNISLDMSGGSAILRARPSSFMGPTSSAGRGQDFSGTISPSSPPRPNTGALSAQHYMSRSSLLSRSDLESGLAARTRTSQPYLKEQTNDYMQEIAVSSSRTELHREVFNLRPASRSGDRGDKEEGARTPHPGNASTFAESWRPHTHSRVPTPLGRQSREHSPYSHLHPLQQSTAEFSSYRFGTESPSSLLAERSLHSPLGRETQDEQGPLIERKESDVRFHSSGMRHIRSEDLG